MSPKHFESTKFSRVPSTASVNTVRLKHSREPKLEAADEAIGWSITDYPTGWPLFCGAYHRNQHTEFTDHSHRNGITFRALAVPQLAQWPECCYQCCFYRASCSSSYVIKWMQFRTKLLDAVPSDRLLQSTDYSSCSLNERFQPKLRLCKLLKAPVRQVANQVEQLEEINLSNLSIVSANNLWPLG